MLPPALGGLRVLRAAVPGPSSAREHGKDQCRAVPARRCNYTTSALSPSNRELKESKRGEMRLWCGRNCISPDDRREEPRSGRYAGCGLAMGNRAPRRCAPGRRNGFAARTRWGCFGGMQALSRNTPHRVRATAISLAARRCQNPADVTSLPLSQSSRRSGYA